MLWCLGVKRDTSNIEIRGSNPRQGIFDFCFVLGLIWAVRCREMFGCIIKGVFCLWSSDISLCTVMGIASLLDLYPIIFLYP